MKTIKRCFLFPGQGAQYPGMGKDLYDADAGVRELFELAAETSGKNTVKLLFHSDTAELKETENTQLAVSLMNLSVRRYLNSHGIKSDLCAGFSLGEFSALVDSGILDEAEVLELVCRRGRCMAEAIQRDEKLASSSAMAAVIGLHSEPLSRSIEEIDEIYPANYNAELQTVISGTKQGLETAVPRLKEAGARRIIPLKVSGPFHSPLMQGAMEQFSKILEDYSFKDPIKPIYSNVHGRPIESGEEAKQLSALQLVSPVLWTTIEAALTEVPELKLYEVGPGKVLSGLWKSLRSETILTVAGNREAADCIIEEENNHE